MALFFNTLLPCMNGESRQFFNECSFTIYFRTCGFPWLAAVILACTSYPEGGRRLRYTYAHHKLRREHTIEGERRYLPAVVDGSSLKAVEPRF